MRKKLKKLKRKRVKFPKLPDNARAITHLPEENIYWCDPVKNEMGIVIPIRTIIKDGMPQSLVLLRLGFRYTNAKNESIARMAFERDGFLKKKVDLILPPEEKTIN